MRPILAVFLVATMSAACVTRPVETYEAAPSGSDVVPTLVVERFLQAVNANDIQTMSRMFGTREGPITRRDSRENVEQRMFALSSLLRHEDYSIIGDRMVPGRGGEAIQIVTRLRQSDRTPTVPFTMVRARDGNWLVEQIGVEDISRR